MKIVLADTTEITIANMSQNLFRENDENEQAGIISFDVDKENINVDEVQSIFTKQNLASFQFVNDEDSLSYTNYKLYNASLYMDDDHVVVSVNIAPIA